MSCCYGAPQSDIVIETKNVLNSKTVILLGDFTFNFLVIVINHTNVDAYIELIDSKIIEIQFSYNQNKYCP